MIVFGQLDELDRRQLAAAIDLLTRRMWADRMQPTPTIRQMYDLLTLSANVPKRTEHCAPTYRPDNVVRVSTTTAATALGVTQRAIVARLNRGTLRGVQLPGRRWLVDADQIPTIAAMSATIVHPVPACPADGASRLPVPGEPPPPRGATQA